jgi:predicted dehydrogenase
MTIRIGILSFAHLHAEGYAALLKTMPGVELIGLADQNAARGAYFADQFGIRQFDTAHDLLNERPHAVIITSENAYHLPIARYAAAAGAHVLCEKPLATRVEDARALVDACAEANVSLMTAFPMRFSPPAIQVKRAIDSGVLGQVYGVNSTNQGMLPEAHQSPDAPAFLDRGWFTDPKLAGGGALTDHLVHLVDLLRWFFACEVTEVYARSSRLLHGERVAVETVGIALITFENGAFASIDASWSKPAHYPTWGGLTLEIVASGGLVVMDAFRQAMQVYSGAVGRGTRAFWGSDANAGMLAEFVSAVRDGRPPAITGEDGLRAVEVVSAAYQSAQTGEVVRLR